MHAYIILICLCVGRVSYSSASSGIGTTQDVGNKFQDSPRIVKDKLLEIWNDTKHKFVGIWGDVEKEVMDACSCINFDCGCCAHLEEKEIELNSTICVNVTYLVHDYGISFTVTVNKHTIFNETVSARNPPPVCLGVPYVKEFVDACIRLYDIDATTTHLHACIRLEARMKMILIAKYEIGCFNIGPPGLSSEDKHMTEHKTSLETNAASSMGSATNMTVIAVAITVGLIVLVAVAISVVIALFRNRGMKAYRTNLLLTRQHKYGILLSASDDGSVKC